MKGYYSPHDAYLAFKKEFPKYEVAEMSIYKNSYLVSVKQDLSNFDFSIPIFLIDRYTGKIDAVSPMMDFKGFSESSLNKQVPFKD